MAKIIEPDFYFDDVNFQEIPKDIITKNFDISNRIFVSNPIMNLEDIFNPNIIPADYLEQLEIESNKQYDILRMSDMIQFLGLVIPKNILFNKIHDLEITMGSQMFSNIPFNILLDNSEFCIYDDCYYLKFKDGLMTYDHNMIGLINLQYAQVHIKLNSECSFPFKFVVSWILLDTEPRRKLAQLPALTNTLSYKNLNMDNGKVIVKDINYTAGIFIRTHKLPTKLSIKFKSEYIKEVRDDVFKKMRSLSTSKINKSFETQLQFLMMDKLNMDSILLKERTQIVRKWNIKETVHNILKRHLIEDIINVIMDYVGGNLHLIWIPFYSTKKHNEYYTQHLACLNDEITLDFGENLNATSYCNIHNVGIYKNGFFELQF